jgi:hypothetical protein
MVQPKSGTDEADSGPSDGPEIDEWRTRPHLTLLIYNIPTKFMVGELKSFLDGFGHTVRIEIFENRDVLLYFLISSDNRRENAMAAGRSSTSMAILSTGTDCRPVPERPFWEAAPKMGSTWFGLKFKLGPPLSTCPPMAAKDGRVLPRAVVIQSLCCKI